MNCPNCQANLSDEAAICPQCGQSLESVLNHPKAQNRPISKRWYVVGVLVILVLISALVIIGPKLGEEVEEAVATEDGAFGGDVINSL